MIAVQQATAIRVQVTNNNSVGSLTDPPKVIDLPVAEIVAPPIAADLPAQPDRAQPAERIQPQ